MTRPVWFMLGGLWAILSSAYFLLDDYLLSRNVVAIACGYPDAAAKAYADCTARRLPQIYPAIWHWFVHDHVLWIAVPALALAGLGFVVGKRA